MRALHMVLFAIAYSIAELILVLVILVQFVTILFTGRASEPLLRFGNGLATYVRQIFRFLTYNTEAMPFPFADWPEEAAEGERWRAPARQAEDAPASTSTASDATTHSPEPPRAPEPPQPPTPPQSP
jgi:hypothetical protein